MTGRALVVRGLGGPVLVQDLGRPGHAAVGVGRSGAADRAAYLLGNRAVGNRAGAASLEVTLGGLEVEVVGGPLWCCLTGAPAAVEVDDRLHPAGAVVAVRHRLRIGTPPRGLRCYLAVRGGIDAGGVLGSRSRDSLAGLGPAPLAEGDVVAVGDEAGTGEAGWPRLDAVPVAALGGTPVLRVVPGPRADLIAEPDRLVTGEWRASAHTDRVGTRLEGGPPLLHRDPERQLPSEGALRGALQVPPSGEPVLFGPDHPVTGGYPVVGVVVDADVDRAAQLRPGDPVVFRWA
ncbi:biotin-dependent carboxyltransferase family protein [Nocardioides zeae]|uniref:5-oxoprolinase subunit C family protein n=1 Tax=Nocardioides zeae TaxID=1457234 RepID=UPI00308404F9